MNIKSVEVNLERRVLRSEWTREMASDLEAYSGIDLEKVEKAIAKELRRERRKKAIDKILNN